MYAFTSKDIAQALVSASQRKVHIKIVLDIAQMKDHFSKSRYLLKQDLKVKFQMGPGLMHDKFAIIDDREVLTGSFNWTVTANKRNSENLLIINDSRLAHQYSNQFATLWKESGEVQFNESFGTDSLKSSNSSNKF